MLDNRMTGNECLDDDILNVMPDLLDIIAIVFKPFVNSCETANQQNKSDNECHIVLYDSCSLLVY